MLGPTTRAAPRLPAQGGHCKVVTICQTLSIISRAL